jgi:integrase
LTIILRAVFAYAVSEGLIERNPALRLEVPDVSGSSVERVWTVDQVKAFLTNTADTPLGPLWWLLAVTGLRRGEALGLNWEDVTFPDIGSPSIEIRRAYVNVKGKAEYGPLKTGRSARRFTIDNDTASLLAAIRDRQKADYGQDWKPSFPVFTRPDLKPVNPNYVTREFQATAARLKLPAIGPHGLRHSLATALGEEGVSLLVVSRLLGHSSTRVTADVYSHTFAETAGNAVALAAGRLRPA